MSFKIFFLYKANNHYIYKDGSGERTLPLIRLWPFMNQKEETMPRVKSNPLLAEISGMMGDAILTKHSDISNGEPSDAQIAQLKQFKQATEYARAAMAQPKVRAAYEEMASKEHKGPFGLAFADYFKGIDLLPSE